MVLYVQQTAVDLQTGTTIEECELASISPAYCKLLHLYIGEVIVLEIAEEKYLKSR